MVERTGLAQGGADTGAVLQTADEVKMQELVDLCLKTPFKASKK